MEYLRSGIKDMISIPVVRGGVQPDDTRDFEDYEDFNSRGAWGSSTL